MIKPLIYDIEKLKDRALNGDGLASYLLGRSYFSSENGVQNDYSESFKWYKYGTEQLNEAKCLYGLGICYDDGVGVEKDSQKADELFKEALPILKQQAENNDPYAMFILGAYYFYGFAGVEQNDSMAFETIYNSAIQGHLAGIYDIGTFYHNGTGVEVDYEKSKEFLELAASIGLERAKQKLDEWENDFKKNIRKIK